MPKTAHEFVGGFEPDAERFLIDLSLLTGSHAGDVIVLRIV